jgi:hypothetical protein
MRGRCTTPEPNAAELANTAAELKTARYNEKMAALFTERNYHDVDSPEREAAAEAILALWVAEG